MLLPTNEECKRVETEREMPKLKFSKSASQAYYISRERENWRFTILQEFQYGKDVFQTTTNKYLSPHRKNVNELDAFLFVWLW